MNLRGKTLEELQKEADEILSKYSLDMVISEDDVDRLGIIEYEMDRLRYPRVVYG